MGAKKKAKLTVIDAVEERPRYGASARDIAEWERARVYKNRIAELEHALGLRSLGNAGESLVVQVTPEMVSALGWLTQTGLYGVSSEGTAKQLLQASLRDPRTMELADGQRWRAEWSVRPRKRRLRRRPRRPGKR